MRSTLCAASRTLTGILFVLICSNLAWADASSWLTAVSGNWSDATKWDNGLPNNGTTLYDAIIAAAGASPYTVTMKSAATVNSFTLNSPQATLDITTGGTLSLAGPAPSQLWAGVLKFSGGTLKGGQLDLHGNSITATATGGTLDGVNVLGDFNLTGKSGKLTVATERTADYVTVSVTDTGAGIPPNLIGRIFEPYESTRQGGSGLGLMIVRRIVQQHDGAIDVDSAVGKGTAVRVRLPTRERRARVLESAATTAKQLAPPDQN